jgi:hypothetical protein
MSSLVSDFIINPVLRQARRFSEASRPTSTSTPTPRPALPTTQQDDEAPSALTDSEEFDDHGFADTPTASPESLNVRPLTSSTQATIVAEDAMPAPTTPTMTPRDGHRDHLGFPISPRRNVPIPEDDGMQALRCKIQAIQARDVPPVEKARLMHSLLSERYNASRAPSLATKPGSPEFELGSSPTTSALDPTALPGPLDSFKFWQGETSQPPIESFILSDSDKAPSFAPLRRPKTPGINTPSADAAAASLADLHPSLGCQHYERNVKLQCLACGKWYPCRLCHDSQEDHKLPRFETRHMLCMLCTTPQAVSDACINCGELAAQYYCSVCKLWENRSSKPIYHCYDCGICRRGLGLGKDYVHCKTCCACIPTSIEMSHKCIERSTDCDCPICGEYMFSSPRPVVFMACGHSIHKKCYDQHMKVSYKCPICNKSLTNMETQFRNLDIAIQGQPMPPEFQDTRAVILCNDCSARSTVPYHWLGLKCAICRSYNTVELQIHGGGSQQLQAALADVAQTQTPDDTVVSSVVIAAQNGMAATERDPIPVAGRRRHSSRVDGVPRRASEITTGSFPPLNMRFESSLGNLPSDNESDDGMMGFWGRGDDDGTDSQIDSEAEQSSDAEDDDEDDDNEILLIGHR